MNISICCPSRGRPELARRMAESAVATCMDAKGLEILFYLNADDPELERYQEGPYTASVVGPDGPTSYAWNQLAARARGDILMLMGDDVVFTTHGWDEKLRKATMPLVRTEKQGPVGVFSFDDGRSPLGTAHPHPALTREAYRRLGYLACPMFRHFYVDTWLTEVAQAAGCFHYLPDVQLQHLKPAEQGGVDETKLRVSRTNVNAADRATYEWAIAGGHKALEIGRLRGDK